MPSKNKIEIKKDSAKEAIPLEEPSQYPPPNWPPEITYLTDQIYSPSVTPEQRTALSATTTDLSRIQESLLALPCPRVSILPITNPSHPAYSQRGLFAAVPLPPNTFICLYLGLVHSNALADTDPSSDYDLSFDRELGLSIDAARSGNEARCANDYRGVPGVERPNAEFRDVLVRVPSERRAGGGKWERRVGIFVLSAGRAGKRKRGIGAGEEILVSYGKGFWDGRKGKEGVDGVVEAFESATIVES